LPFAAGKKMKRHEEEEAIERAIQLRFGTLTIKSLSCSAFSTYQCQEGVIAYFHHVAIQHITGCKQFPVRLQDSCGSSNAEERCIGRQPDEQEAQLSLRQFALLVIGSSVHCSVTCQYARLSDNK